MPLPEEREGQLSVGGFQGIKKIRGLLVDIDVVNPPETWENQEKQVVVVKMEDTAVLEMFGDEDAFELKEGKFNFYIPYAAPGVKPHQNSIYSKCWLASAKELGKVPSQFIGQYVILEKQSRLLFETRLSKDKLDKDLEFGLDKDGSKTLNMIVFRDEQGNVDEKKGTILVHVIAATKEGRPNHFCFVANGEAGSENINDYIRNLVVGLNQKAALRKLLIDVKAKQHPEYKNALNEGTLAEMLELVIVDDKFQKAEERDATVE